MRSICFYFQVHQPFRLRTYRFFDIGKDHYYYDDYENRHIIRRIAEKSYLPANKIMLDLIRDYGKDFKIAYSISGVALDQFKMYVPEVIDSFRALADTGNVEFLAETNSHSLASLRDKDEFFRQVSLHSRKLEELFGVKPVTFRNTELIYSDGIGEMAHEMGFKSILAEGAKHVLGWKSPNYLYCNAINPKMKVLLRNFRLSDDIAFRYSEKGWSEWPLTPTKFAKWLNEVDKREETVNLFMDYETFGEHQWDDTGIMKFLKDLPGKILSDTDFSFLTPSEAAAALQPVSAIHAPNPISWADEERDLTAWLGNELQDEAFRKLYSGLEMMKNCDDADLKRDWDYLQTSDHFYYMCTKWFSDGEVHKYFNPYKSPYDAFINYMNVLSDFLSRLKEYSASSQMPGKEPAKASKKTSSGSRKPGKKAKLIDPFSFDNIINIPKINLKKVFRDMNVRTLALAMQGADNEIKERVVSSLARRPMNKYVSMQLDESDITELAVSGARSEIEDELRNLLG